MRVAAYESIVRALVSSLPDGQRRERLLDRLQQIFNFPRKEHEIIIAECIGNDYYFLHLQADVTDEESIRLKLADGKHVEWTPAKKDDEIPLGHSRQQQLSVWVSEKSGVRRRKSGSSPTSRILSRFSFDRTRRPLPLILDLSSLVPDVPVVRQVPTGSGTTCPVHVTLTKRSSREYACELRLLDALELVRTLLIAELNSETPEEAEDAYFLLHGPFLFYSLPGLLIRLLSIAVLLGWPGRSSSATALLNQHIDALSQADLSLPFGDHAALLIKRGLVHVSRCTSTDASAVLKSLADVSLFPPASSNTVLLFNKALQHVMRVCIWPAWEKFQVADPAAALHEQLLALLLCSTRKWSDEELKWECSIAEGREKELWLLLDNLNDVMTRHAQAYCIFFEQFGIDYVATVAVGIREKLEETVRGMLSFLLAEISSRRELTSIEHFTKCSMRLFRSLHSLSETLKAEGSLRSPPGPLGHFEEWFGSAPIYWTTTWRQLSHDMGKRAASLDEKEEEEGEESGGHKEAHPPPLPASLYSFLCIQKGLSDDLVKMAFRLPHNVMLSSLKMMNIYCDNLTSYSKHLFQLANSCRHTDNKRLQRLARSANGIEQACLFISSKWRRLISADRLDILSDGHLLLLSAQKLLQDAHQKCLRLRDLLVAIIVKNRSGDAVERIARKIVMDRKELSLTLAGYMRDLSEEERAEEVSVEMERLSMECGEGLEVGGAVVASAILFKTLRTHVKRNLMPNQPLNYYSFVHKALEAVSYGLGEEAGGVEGDLLRLLSLHSLPCRHLILACFSQLAELSEQSSSRPSILLIPSADTSRSSTITLSIQVLECVCTRWRNGTSSVSLRLELEPRNLFPSSASSLFCSKVYRRNASSRCRFKHTFNLRVSEEAFYTNGSVAAVSLVEKDYLSFERVIGTAYISLASIPSTASPPILRNLALLPHSVLIQLEPFVILRRRNLKNEDRTVRDFVRSECLREAKCYSLRATTSIYESFTNLSTSSSPRHHSL